MRVRLGVAVAASLLASGCSHSSVLPNKIAGSPGIVISSAPATPSASPSQKEVRPAPDTSSPISLVRSYLETISATRPLTAAAIAPFVTDGYQPDEAVVRAAIYSVNVKRFRIIRVRQSSDTSQYVDVSLSLTECKAPNNCHDRNRESEFHVYAQGGKYQFKANNGWREGI
jgi:hypothetical protein